MNEERRRLADCYGYTVISGKETQSPNPLEYAPKGTLKELVELRSLVRDCREVVRDKVEQNPWPAESGGFASGCKFCGKPYPQAFSNADEHYDNCSWLKAAALLPRIDAAVGEEEAVTNAITWISACPCPSIPKDCVLMRRELIMEVAYELQEAGKVVLMHELLAAIELGQEIPGEEEKP